MNKLRFVGKGKLIAFTNTNHYEPDVVARYWFAGDEREVRLKNGRFKPVPFAVVRHQGTTRYALGLHGEAEAATLMESLDQLEVLLHVDGNDHFWFCVCQKSTPSSELSKLSSVASETSSPARPESWRSTTKTPSILFTDVKNSTSMTNAIGQHAARALIRELEHIIAAAATTHNGRVLKEMGDGTMAAFPTASAAIEAAVAMQRETTKTFRDRPVKLRIRIGIDAGEPIDEGKDIYGTPVILAQRTMNQADGGQILVTETVRNLVRGKRYEFIEHGQPPLKGFEDPITLFQVLWTQGALLILGVAGKAGSGFDSTVLRTLERCESFSIIRADDFVDIAWRVSEVKARVGERFGKEVVFENAAHADPSQWQRRRGVLGKIVASDPASAEDLNAILNPYVTTLTFAHILQLVREGNRRIAIASTRLANDELKVCCHRTWFVERGEDQRRRSLELQYSERNFSADYISAKVEQIMRLQRDVIEPLEFPYDDVIDHPENGEAFEQTITQKVRAMLLSGQEGIDGPEEYSVGPRHGQFVRSMLSLSQIRGCPIKLVGRRLFNPKSGDLEASIKACVDACVTWSGGTMNVSRPGFAVEFRPGRKIPSSDVVTFDLASDLSVSLLVVTLIPMCLQHNQSFDFILRGCTDLEHSSPVDYYKNVLFPLLEKLGIRINMDIERRGFWGGRQGVVRLSVRGAERLKRLDLTDRGEPQSITFSHNSSGLDESFYQIFIERMSRFCVHVDFRGDQRFQGERHVGPQKSVSLSIALRTEHSILGADAVCDRDCDVSAHDRVISSLLEKAEKLLKSRAALDHFTADKIIVYLALAGGSATLPIVDDMEHIYTQLSLVSWFHKGGMEVSVRDSVLRVEMDPMFGNPG